MTNEPTRSLNTSFTSENADLDSEDFPTFLNNYDYHFSPGDIVAGTVFSLEPRGALIDIGAKTAAYIPIQEMSINRIDSPEEVLQPNETREFFILTDENEDGQLTLSIRRIEYMRAWERSRQMQAEDVTIRATVFATNKGGALVRVEGLRGFIPGSHISTHKPKEELIGEELPLKFLEVDEDRNRLVLSHRRALVVSKMNRLEVGEVVSGTVRGIKPYGAFIDIGGVSALLINSEISHEHVEDPHSVFQVNDEIKAIIIDLDAERGRISVSTKVLELEPGDMLKYPQLVYERAEETAAKYREHILSRLNSDEEDIALYKQALQEINREQSPSEWAEVQSNLATAYFNRFKGDRAENLEQAIAASESALQVYTREAFPELWAKTQATLAKAYSERIGGDRAENLERAIAACQLALQVYTREAFPEDWAKTQTNLAIAYSKRFQGDRADNIEQAISAYESALQVYTHEAFPRDWARTQMGLAEVYFDRIQGDRVGNIGQAIVAYTEAVQVFRQLGLAQELSRTLHNLGLACNNQARNKIEPDQNRERAIEAYIESSQICRQLSLHRDLSITLNNLGAVYCDSQRFEEAIRSWNESLTVCQEQRDSLNSFDALSYLGNIYRDLNEYQQSLDYLQQALNIARDVGGYYHQLKALNNLGNTYYCLKEYQQALNCYQEALPIVQEALPIVQEWGDHRSKSLTLIGLADAYQALGNHQQSVDLYEQALVTSQQIADEELGVSIQSKLAQALLQVENFERAIAVTQSIPDARKRLAWLTRVIEKFQNLEDYRAEELLAPLRIDLDERIQEIIGTEDVLRIVNNIVLTKTFKPLSDLQLGVFRGAWRSKDFKTMAQELDCNLEHLKRNVAPSFWRLLSEILETRITKGNLRQSVEAYIHRETDRLNRIALDSLQSSDFENAIARAQEIPDRQVRLEVLTRVIRVVKESAGDRIEELLLPLRNSSDARIHQAITEILEPISRASESTHYKNLIDLLQSCTVKLSVPGQTGWGTGSFISPGLILTCAYVVDKANSGSVNVLWQGQSYTAEISIMEAGGIAVLRLQPQLSIEHPCIYLGEIGEFTQPGDRLYCFGYQDNFPNGSSVTFECEGLTGDNPPLLKFKSGQVRPGLGGAPLLSLRTGKICGIVASTRDRSSNLGGDAIPAEVILSRSLDLEKSHRRFHEKDKTWVNFLPSLPSPTESNRLMLQEALVERLKSCTVKLRSSNQTSWGTGYLVQPDLILTCDFVVNGAEGSSIEVDWVVQGLIETATVEVVLPDAGLTVLRIPDPLSEVAPLALDTNNAELDDSFYSYGYPDQDYPNGCPVTFKHAGSARDANNLPILNLVEGQIRPGMVGAPVLNLRTGKIAGIIKFTHDRVAAVGGGAIPSTAILSRLPQLAQTNYESSQSSSKSLQLLTYCVSIEALQEKVALGGDLEIIVSLRPSVEGQSDSYSLEIPQNESLGSELNILLNTPGFQVVGDNAASLPLDLDANIQQTSQTISFHLIALRPGISTITAEIYRGDTFETALETIIQVVGLEEATFFDTTIKTEPRPVSQPDLVLQVQTLCNETASACTFRYHLKSFRAASFLRSGISYQSQQLSRSWLEQVHNLLQTELETLSDALPTDGLSHLISLGHYLFQHLFPAELQTDLRNLNRYQSHTLLILADQDAQFPWTLLHNGQEFLGERFIIGHWLWDLNNTQPYEFPVGAINLAHYANVEQPEVWATLLEPPGAPPPLILTGGVLDDLAATEAMRGLHLIRMGQSTADGDRQDAPVPLGTATEDQDMNQKIRPIKLNLRRNRPLVTLGYLRQDQPELTHLQQTWAATFLRAGCSAFVGTLWAVNPSVEAAFISSFYHALWTGDSLGGAFHTACRLARATVPDSLDWLAYLLFGDPMARPYRPVQGQGYAVVEPIGQDIDDPVPLGTTIRFRVSLRRTPPIWHEERVIEVAETLNFTDLQAHIVTFGLQITPATPISLKSMVSGNFVGWFNLTVPEELAGKNALVQVQIMDGILPIHSLTFSLNIEGGRE